MTNEAGAALPLDGIRVLELGMVFVLPYAITPLAALGADVIKIEAAARPDSVRWGPPPDNKPREDGYNHGAHFQGLNRAKRGITLDLTHPRGRGLVLQLVAISDVVAENFTPRVLQNFGLGYEQLRAVNERIILLSSSGFGQTGPWRNYRAYGPNTEAVDGLMHLTGYPDGPPVRAGAGGLGVAFTDAAGAFFGTYAILAALEQRERTGVGQWLDLSHYEAGAATIPEAMLESTMNGRTPGRAANRHPCRAPQGVYPCAGDDRWIAISVASDAEFATLARVIGSPDLACDERFATLTARQRHHDELDALLANWTRTRNAAQIEHELQAVGVEAAAVATPRDVWFDPQLHHRRFFELAPAPASAPEIGERPHLRPVWRGSVPSARRRRAPEFGQHTREVLIGCLGLHDDDLASLAADGVIADAPMPGVIARPGPMDLPTLVESGRLRELDPDYREQIEKRLKEESDDS
ncbi:MAG TPA: CoA transferase [Steroidobacteraceae bacterium]|nr:CoA transferase [Steroidobacteraceae bacterium]